MTVVRSAPKSWTEAEEFGLPTFALSFMVLFLGANANSSFRRNTMLQVLRGSRRPPYRPAWSLLLLSDSSRWFAIVNAEAKFMNTETRAVCNVSPAICLLIAGLLIAPGCRNMGATPKNELDGSHNAQATVKKANDTVENDDAKAHSETDEKLDDTSIARAINAELSYDGLVPNLGVDIESANGIVTLTGAVDNLSAKRRATRIAETVRGVRAVSNRIVIEPGQAISDDKLARNVNEALLVDPATDSYEIDVSATNGTVVLKGVVDSWAEQDLADSVAGAVRGVREVDNQLIVKYDNVRPDSELAAEIRERLRWDLLVDEHGLQVAVDDAKVSLSGYVGSAAERRRAESDAWVLGVENVDSSGVRVEWFAKDPHVRRANEEKPSPDAIERAFELATVYDPRVSSFDVHPRANGRVLTIDGIVDNLPAKRAAEELAKHTTGVYYVINRIDVVPKSTDSDAEIASKINTRLMTNPYTDSFKISVSVDDAVATLRGQVDSELEKSEAHAVAFATRGILAVDNELVVRERTARRLFSPYVYPYQPRIDTWSRPLPTVPLYSDAQLKDRIEDEIFWSPFVDSDEVDVRVDGGNAMLLGTVDTWRERAAAADNAFEAGALRVDNRLAIDVGS